MNIYKQSFLVRVSYDGTDYQGWQVQSNGPTVAATMQDTFKRVFGHTLSMVGASRTDSGVHARDQVARVRTDIAIAPKRLMHAWNNALPHDIVITELYAVDSAFHPHHNIMYKEYAYRIFLSRPLPFCARFGWWPEVYMSEFDMTVFNDALSRFVGTHNFTAFSKDEPGRESTRGVDVCSAVSSGQSELLVTIRGKGFLRYQIRRMIGAALMAASSTTVTPALISQLLTDPNHPLAHNLLNADPRGLCLQHIVYSDH